MVHNADGSAFIDNYLGEVNWEAVIPPVKALRVGAAARAIPRAKAFEKAGIKTEEHFLQRLERRGSRGIDERNALVVSQRPLVL